MPRSMCVCECVCVCVCEGVCVCVCVCVCVWRLKHEVLDGKYIFLCQ
jgi:hypothetical protein